MSAVTVASRAVRDHTGQKFAHFIVDCAGVKGDRSQEAHRLHVAQDLNTFFAYSSLISSLTDQDRVLAERLLDGVRTSVRA